MKKTLSKGTHILAIPTMETTTLTELFPKELSGSTIEILSRDGTWIDKETVNYKNNTFIFNSGIYRTIPPLSTVRLTLKRPVQIDWYSHFESRSRAIEKTHHFQAGFDFNKALLLCQLSNLIYEDEVSIYNTIQSNFDFEDYYYYSKSSHKNLLNNNFRALLLAFIRGKRSVVDLQFMYLQKFDSATNKNIITLVFQGSQEPQDWMTNFTFKDIDFLKRGKVHQGFYQAFRLFFQTLRKNSKNKNNNIPTSIFSDIENFNQTSKILLAGHSLGGALATLTSCYLIEQGISSENIEVYSFGSPPVGTEEFCQYYQNRFDLYRLVNSEDVIPKLDKISNLRHFGAEIVLPSNEGEIHSCEGYIDNIIDQLQTKKIKKT